MADARKGLQIALVAAGLICFTVYPLVLFWPSGWAWTPGGEEYMQMLVAIYATLGVFLLRAARAPENHLSLIWFTVWSSVVHGGVMAVQAWFDHTEHGHFYGDIPALFLLALVLGWLTRQMGRQAYWAA